MCVFFVFNDTATTEIYTLSLHDALPISGGDDRPEAAEGVAVRPRFPGSAPPGAPAHARRRRPGGRPPAAVGGTGLDADGGLRGGGEPLPVGLPHPAGRLRGDGVPPLGGALAAAPGRAALRPTHGGAGHRSHAAAPRRARLLRPGGLSPRVGPLCRRRLRVARAPGHRPLPPRGGPRHRHPRHRGLGEVRERTPFPPPLASSGWCPEGGRHSQAPVLTSAVAVLPAGAPPPPPGPGGAEPGGGGSPGPGEN